MLEKIKKWVRRPGVGYYGALALLLVLLALASNAWRERASRASQEPETPPAAVASILQPANEPAEAEPEPPRWVWPVEGEIIGGYSPDAPVWSQTLSQWQTHPALDIAGLPGEAIYACADGTVLDAYSDRLWGNVIVIGHEDGYQSTYAGVNTLKLVSPGDAVSAGDVISAVGLPAGCEADMAAHLHLELTKDGESVDFTSLIDGTGST